MNQEREAIPEKLYFSIGEVSEITNLPAYVLRFWEDKFPFLRPQKSRGGHRRYQKKDIELILKIKELLYDRGYTIEGARKELEGGKSREGRDIPELSWVKEEIKSIIDILS